MSYTNKTANFELPQYIASDKPSYLGDFNEAMRKIDSQMEENRVSAAEAGTGMADAQAKLDKAQTDVGNAQTQLNALSAQVTKIENDASGIAANASQAFADANQANATSQTAVTTASNASTQAQAAQQSVATLNADVTGLDARVTALEGKSRSNITSACLIFNKGANYNIMSAAAKVPDKTGSVKLKIINNTGIFPTLSGFYYIGTTPPIDLNAGISAVAISDREEKTINVPEGSQLWVGISCSGVAPTNMGSVTVDYEIN